MLDNQTPSPTSPKRCTAPIERLYFDILSQIFLECLSETQLSSVRMSEAPVLLGRICSHWRAVVLNTPMLWAGLMLGSGRVQNDDAKDAMAAAEWKIRAGSCLMSYSLWRTPDVIDVILPHCGQWRTINAHLEFDGWHKMYAAISQGAPCLRYLALEILASRLSSGFIQQIDIALPIPGASQLQKLITATNCRVHFNRMEAPSLRKLLFYGPTLTAGPVSDIAHISSISRLVAILDLLSDSVPKLSKPTHYYKVFEMELSRPGFDLLLDVIRAPSLESLDCTFRHSIDDNRVVCALSHFLKRSGACLLTWISTH
ncbi:hypothetical protein BD410DRAFT_637324 [Rickenella mellea]|uniref:F-box domain-containing protein n=1 Tax=Rickenella mellea TaxID=50990 RepID=A0A4Y7QDE2_9AGAM|nr:hypothetical protein BD410DRAFT_637324 [Rickenella mellea]